MTVDELKTLLQNNEQDAEIVFLDPEQLTADLNERQAMMVDEIWPDQESGKVYISFRHEQ